MDPCAAAVSKEVDDEERCVRALTASAPVQPSALVPSASVETWLSTFRADGALILKQCLPLSTLDCLSTHIEEERDAARALAARDPCEEKACFGDVLSRHCRSDLKLKLEEGSPVQTALAQLLDGEGSALRQLLVDLLGDDAELYELACMTSEPGARRQPVHPDTPCEPGVADGPPLVVTGFVALQDVTRAMGPTIVWRGTHTAAAHAAWEEEGAGLLARSPAHIALLSEGDILLFDSRALHCGGENSAADGHRRGLFYFSFKRARIVTGKSGPGTLRAELHGRYSIGDIHIGKEAADEWTK